MSPDGGNIQDASAFSADHGGDGKPAGVEAGTQVGVHDAVPVCHGHLGEKPEIRDAGVVNQHVEGRKLCKKALHCLVVRHVAGDCRAGGTECVSQLLLQQKKRIRTVRAGEKSMAAVFGKNSCNGGAYAAGCAGDENGFHGNKVPFCKVMVSCACTIPVS